MQSTDEATDKAVVTARTSVYKHLHAHGHVHVHGQSIQHRERHHGLPTSLSNKRRGSLRGTTRPHVDLSADHVNCCGIQWASHRRMLLTEHLQCHGAVLLKVLHWRGGKQSDVIQRLCLVELLEASLRVPNGTTALATRRAEGTLIY